MSGALDLQIIEGRYLDISSYHITQSYGSHGGVCRVRYRSLGSWIDDSERSTLHIMELSHVVAVLIAYCVPAFLPAPLPSIELLLCLPRSHLQSFSRAANLQHVQSTATIVRSSCCNILRLRQCTDFPKTGNMSYLRLRPSTRRVSDLCLNLSLLSH